MPAVDSAVRVTVWHKVFCRKYGHKSVDCYVRAGDIRVTARSLDRISDGKEIPTWNEALAKWGNTFGHEEEMSS